jgi:hypothetical protein
VTRTYRLFTDRPLASNRLRAVDRHAREIRVGGSVVPVLAGHLRLP